MYNNNNNNNNYNNNNFNNIYYSIKHYTQKIKYYYSFKYY